MVKYGPGVALLVVDVQNDFADPQGSLSVRGGAALVAVISGHIERARAAGAFVAYTQDWHPPETPHFAKDGGIWPVHCIAGSWGARLHPDLTVDGPVVRKGASGEDGYSGFTMRHPTTGETEPTELDAVLRRARVARVVVCGLATDYCVRETVLDALRLGYAASVAAEAIAAVDLVPGDGERALEAMRRAGAEVVPS